MDQLNPVPSQNHISPASGCYGASDQELHLDVPDGSEPFPQMVASGNFTDQPDRRVHWVVGDLKPMSVDNYWTGKICYTEPKVREIDGAEVHIWLSGGPNEHTAHVRFGAHPGNKVICLPYRSRSHRQIELVFAAEKGEEKVIEIREESEVQSIPAVFHRAGFEVTATDVLEPVESVGAEKEGPQDTWSDKELHDAMQDYWKAHSSDVPHGIWVFFCSSHDLDLGGTMFDLVEPKFRQGCAIFRGGQPRELFFRACHEIGHCFNLAHSSSEMGGVAGSEEWFESRAEPTAVSFMIDSNFPSDLEKYRFSGHDQTSRGRDLTFLRHAPESFIYPSGIPFMHSGSGFKAAPEPGVTLEVRVNRDEPLFEFMEPVSLELKLANTSGDNKTFPTNPLAWSEDMIVTIQRDGEKTGQRFWPYKRDCRVPRKAKVELGPGKAIYESLFISAGVKRDGGWFISDPGSYTIRVALRVNDIVIQADPLVVHVLAPGGDDLKGQEDLAARFFSDDVARTIAFHGSRFSDRGKGVLEDVAERLKGRRVAIHAAWTLGKRVAYRDKRVYVDRDGGLERLRIGIDQPVQEEARSKLYGALMEKPATVAESFGHIDYRLCADFLSRWLCDGGDSPSAVKVQNALYDVMSTRQVRRRPILPSVLQSIAQRRDYVREHGTWS